MKRRKTDFKKLTLSKEVVANVNGGLDLGLGPTVFCETIDFTRCNGRPVCEIFPRTEGCRF